MLCSTEQNSELFSFPWNGSKRNSERIRNSESLLLFFFHGIEFRAFSLPRMIWGNSESLLLFHSTKFRAFFLPWVGSERKPRVFCSTEQPEFCRNKPFVSSIPSSAELFHVGNSLLLVSEGIMPCTPLE